MRFVKAIVFCAAAAACAWGAFVATRHARSAPPALAAVAGQDVLAAARAAPARIVAPTQPLPSGDFGAIAAALAERAEHDDVAAAAALARGHFRCSIASIAKGAAAMERAAMEDAANVAGMRRSVESAARVGGSDVPRSVEPDAGDVANEAFARRIALARDCKGLPDADDPLAAYETAMHFEERAAALGDPDAQLLYWHDALAFAQKWMAVETVRRKPLAARFVREAIARGDWRALAAAGVMMREGWFGSSEQDTGVAYLFAALRAPQLAQAQVPWLRPGIDEPTVPMKPWLEAEIRRAASGLTEAQIRAAALRGEALYTECCTR